MAIFIVSNTGGNINAGATYVGGVAPTSTDSIAFTATSGQLTVNVAWTTAGFNCTNWTNTLTVNNTLTVTGGNVTLVAAMTITTTSGTPILSINTGGGTLTSNGKTWSYALKVQGASAFTLADNWIVGTLTVVNTTTLNGNALTVNGALTLSLGTISGTTNITLAGNSTLGGSAVIQNNLTITGTYTTTSTIFYNTGTLTCLTGTINQGVQSIVCVSSTTFNIGSSISNLQCQNGTFTLLSDTTIINYVFGVTGAVVMNGFTLYVSGNFTPTNNITARGTTNIIFNGNSTWTTPGVGAIQNNVTVTGTLTIIGTWYYQLGTFTNSGTLYTESSFLVTAVSGTTTFNMNGAKLGGFTLGGGSTINTVSLTSPLYVLNGICLLGAGSQVQTINGSTLYIESGTLTSAANSFAAVNGTSQIYITGDKASITDPSTTSNAGSSIWSLPITIDIRGNCIITGRLNLAAGGNLTILNGTIDNRAAVRNVPTLVITGNVTLTNIDRCKFRSITITNGLTITMNKFFNGSPENKTIIRSSSTTNYTITFTDSVPKKSFSVNIKNATITNNNILNIIGRDSNSGLNSGIIFGEGGLDGFPLNKYGAENSYGTISGFSQGGMNN